MCTWQWHNHKHDHDLPLDDSFWLHAFPIAQYYFDTIYPIVQSYIHTYVHMYVMKNQTMNRKKNSLKTVHLSLAGEGLTFHKVSKENVKRAWKVS